MKIVRYGNVFLLKNKRNSVNSPNTVLVKIIHVHDNILSFIKHSLFVDVWPSKIKTKTRLSVHTYLVYNRLFRICFISYLGVRKWFQFYLNFPFTQSESSKKQKLNTWHCIIVNCFN